MSRQTLKKRAKNLRIVVNNGKRHYKPIKYPTNIPLQNTDIYFLTTFGDRLDLLAKSIYKDERLWWIIAIANPEIDNLTDTDMQALPHVLDVDCQFVPIHDFIPRKSVDSTPFFGKTNGDSGTARDFYDKGAETFSTVKSRVEQTGNSNGE